MSAECGQTIDGPKVGRRVVAWRNYCRVKVASPGERCRFHGRPCPKCGTEMYDVPGWSHQANCDGTP